MAKKIYMTNLKGGTGVTTCCTGIALALAEAGYRTLVADGDRYGAGALIAGGCANMQTYTLADYAKGACRAKQTLVFSPSSQNLCFCPSLGLDDGSAAAKAIGELDGLFDYILSDKLAPEKCDGAIIVTEPFLPSLKCADACRAKLSDGGIKDIALIVNRLNGGLVLSGAIMTAQEIASLLHLPLKGVIPEDLSIPLGKHKRSTQRAFKLTADSIIGKSNAVYDALRPYSGMHGYIKRKARESV